MLLALFCSNFLAFALETPSTVGRFYNGMKSLESASSLNAANSIQQDMASCFMASEQSGINLSMDDFGEMSSARYTIKLFTKIYTEKSMRTDYTILRTEQVEQPDQNGSAQKKGAQHYVSYVKKNYVVDGKSKSYNDIVFTFINNGLIIGMENAADDGGISIKPSNEDELSIEHLRARAAYFYTQKQYSQAYSYYEQIMKRASTDGDAAYRIALMTFWRKGCKSRFKNRQAAQDKAKEYIAVAVKYGSSEIRHKATSVRDNWENKNVYF